MRRCAEQILLQGAAEAVVDVDSAIMADCLILDIELPGMSGLDLYRTLARLGLTTSTIFITAHNQPNLRNEAEQLGAASYLTKPFSGQALLSAVAEATKVD